MSVGLSFGALPSFADLTPDMRAQVMAALQQGQPTPVSQGAPQGSLGGLLGQPDPPAPGGPLGRPGAPVAVSEHDVQRLEWQQASPQDLAALGGSPVDHLLYDRAGMGAPDNAFSGSAGGAIPQADGMGARPVPLPPQRPSDADLLASPVATGSLPGLPQGQTVASSKSVPGPGPNQYLPATPADRAAEPTGGSPLAGAFDPLTGQPVSGSPRPLGAPQGGVSPSAAAAATGAATGRDTSPGVFERFAQGLGNPELSNLLLNVGIGLMSQRGFGPGIAAGLQNYQTSQAGSLKNQLQQIQFLQQQQGQQATYGSLRKAGFSHEQAMAGMYNPTMLSNLLQQQNKAPTTIDLGADKYLVPQGAGNDPTQWQRIGASSAPPAGYRLSADQKSYEYIPGSEADPAVKERNAKAVATDKEQTPLLDLEARRKVGIPDSDTRAAWADPNGKVTFNDGPPLIQGRPGQTVYERGSLRPLLTVPPAKPDGYDTETKLRGESRRDLGSFQDVHDGYNRLIAATKQRQENPGSVSPASDISLIFGYMKMLDPGSVVREGEYATAKNAAGIPERVTNAYNKALNGEFLTDSQRRDFLHQASELYGTARKTAEGVAERYRGLATSYGVDPGRSVYLPDAPVAPKIGQPAAGTNAAASRYMELRRGGLSQSDAFAKMRQEGL